MNFSSELYYSTLSNSDFVITITKSTDFTYEFVSAELPLSLFLRVNMKEQAKNRQMTLKFTNVIFIQANILENVDKTKDI